MNNERSFKRLNVPAAAKLLKQEDVLILDARDANAFGSGAIPGAKRLSSQNLDRTLLSGERSRPVLIYCYHGNASQTYAQMFADFGYTKVYDLIDGYEAWRMQMASDDPVVPGDVYIAAWLAAEGFPLDLNARIGNRTTALMHAAYRGNVQIVTRLLELNAPLEETNGDGNTALWLACAGGNVEIVRLLATAGCALDHQNDNGATALMYAASSGKAEIVASLLAAGAALAPQSIDGFSALDMAATPECLQLMRRAQRAQLATL